MKTLIVIGIIGVVIFAIWKVANAKDSKSESEFREGVAGLSFPGNFLGLLDQSGVKL